MGTLLFVLVQLTLVTVVYIAAYKSGYKASQEKAVSVLQEYTSPVRELLDNINETMDLAGETQKKKGVK